MEEKSLNLLSIGEASEYLGISIDTLRRWEKKEKIASYRSPGGHRYFKKEELDTMFGKKYERVEEVAPRKEYETKSKIPDTEPAIEEIENSEETNAQETVDSILSEVETVKNEVESFFDRQPKNIQIPKLDPIKVVSAFESSQPVVEKSTASATPQPKLFTSFSHLPGQDLKYPGKNNALSTQYILIIVAAVVVLVALIFAVTYFASQPKIISPI